MTDPINHPPYYRGTNGIEAWDVIEGFGLNYNLGVAVAYLLRSEHKGDPVKDMRKAVAHINREIEQRSRPASRGMDNSDSAHQAYLIDIQRRTEWEYYHPGEPCPKSKPES
jgi:hypothetical protein